MPTPNQNGGPDQLNETETIIALTAQGFAERHANDDGAPYLIVPDGYRIEELEKFLPQPDRIRQSPTFISLASFSRYVNDFKQDGTTIFISTAGNATAVIDGPSKGVPRWREHTASYAVTYSERWAVWDRNAKKTFSQLSFAQFVEDNNVDFIKPLGGDMLDMARTLEAEQNSTFKSGLRLDNGDVQLGYTKTTAAKAGQNGSMEIPSLCQIAIPVLESEAPRIIDLRLRYDLAEGKITFSYEIIRRAALLEQVRRFILSTITSDTNLEPFLIQ